MTCIIVDLDNWTEIATSHDHIFKLVKDIAETENPFDDGTSVIFDRNGNHSIVDLMKRNSCWSAYLYIPERPKLFLYCDEILADRNQWRFKYSEKNHKISNNDAEKMRAGIVQAIQVLYYINNMDTYFVKPDRATRRRLQKSSKSLKEQK